MTRSSESLLLRVQRARIYQGPSQVLVTGASVNIRMTNAVDNEHHHHDIPNPPIPSYTTSATRFVDFLVSVDIIMSEGAEVTDKVVRTCFPRTCSTIIQTTATTAFTT
ncbi:hypothetical protein BgiBS90_017150, partial [Biomphalaria glabrata]